MSERSEPGPTTAPGVGTVSDELLRLRPDLDTLPVHVCTAIVIADWGH